MPMYICAVCNDSCTGRATYEVHTCRKCRSFVKRNYLKQDRTNCKNKRTCRNREVLKCAECRFKKCIRSGVKMGDLIKKVVGKLAVSNDKRHENLQIRYPVQDYSMEDISGPSGLIEFERRPKSFTMNMDEWSYLAVVTGAHCLRRFEFVEKLSTRDRCIILKRWNRHFSFLAIAMNCIRFDVIGVDSTGIYEGQIMPKLIGKLRELKVRWVEGLLVNAMLACNPTTSKISKTAKSVLKQYQDKYRSMLQWTVRRSPTRFRKLMTIFRIVAKTVTDFEKQQTRANLNRPNLVRKRIFNS